MRKDQPIRTEVIESDKDGTLEKRWFRKESRREKDGSIKVIEPWEVHATGKKCYELKGAFKDSAPQMFQDGLKEWNKYGGVKITKPDGSVDEVRADKEHIYRDMPGFCNLATRPTFVVPNLPWQDDREIGETYQNYMQRKAAEG